MSEAIKTVGGWLIWGASLLAACGALWKWLAKPIREINIKMSTCLTNTDALMGDRLAQAHDYWVKKGYCPKADKRRIVDMHRRYAARGLNHLAEHYEQDILGLPEHPAGEATKGA